MCEKRYPVEVLDKEYDNGTMPENVAALAEAVVGRRIVSALRSEEAYDLYGDRFGRGDALLLTLDNGTRVRMSDTSDCCAYTMVEKFLLNPELVNHVITGVGTTDGYTTWHIYADLGDILKLDVGWSPGNKFYYGYGFNITVEPDVFVIHESTPRKSIDWSGAERG